MDISPNTEISRLIGRLKWPESKNTKVTLNSKIVEFITSKSKYTQVRQFIKHCKLGEEDLIDPVTGDSMDPKNIDEGEILSMKSNNEAQQDVYTEEPNPLKENEEEDFDPYDDTPKVKKGIYSAQVATQNLNTTASISVQTELSRQQNYVGSPAVSPPAEALSNSSVVVSQEKPQASPTCSSAPSFDTTTTSRLSSTIKEDDGDDTNESKSGDSINSSSSSALVTPTSSQNTNIVSQHQQAMGECQP